MVVQAEGRFRNDLTTVKRLKVRNAGGGMVPLGAVLKVRRQSRPARSSARYNMYPAAAIVGNTKPGVSSGEGIVEMERLAKQTLPQGMSYEWTEINFIQIDAAKNVWNNLIFPLAVVFVFLVLAAQYESWALPLAVILVVPMCILGSLIGVAVTDGDINIFTQIGFVVLVGLASKNAILIVEFAKHKRESGLSRRDATLAACKLRLRPILMTSFAFILGVVPLMIAVGAGAEMRRALGMAVFSGMLGVTLFGIFLTPVFFYVIEGAAEQPVFRLIGAYTWGGSRRLLRAARTEIGRLWRRRAAALPAAPSNGHAPPTPVKVVGGRMETRQRQRRRRTTSPTATATASRRAASRRRRDGSDASEVSGIGPGSTGSSDWLNRNCPKALRPCRVLALLHRPPDLRRGAVHLHHAGRRHRPVDAAGRAVPGHRAADRRGVRVLPRRQRPASSPTPWPPPSSSRSTASRT